MDPLSVSLVHQYLRTYNPALAEDFKATYKPKKTSVDLEEVLSYWDENQLARGVVYKHLEKVHKYKPQQSIQRLSWFCEEAEEHR